MVLMSLFAGQEYRDTDIKDRLVDISRERRMWDRLREEH